jgi:chaperonin GroEL
VIVTEGETTILGGAGDKGGVAARIAQIKVELDRVDNERDREHLKERLARLAGRVAVIHVGAATAVELKERRRRTEGALAATRAALEQGILPGGGIALVNAERVLDRSNGNAGEEALGRRQFAPRFQSRCAGSPPTPGTTATPSSSGCAPSHQVGLSTR